MPKPIDISALLRRGGELSAAEEKQLIEEWNEAKLTELREAARSRGWDQPVKVVPLRGDPPKFVSGYFTQEKFINAKTPSEMGTALGVFGPFSEGVFVMEFEAMLQKGDFETKAYSYLPKGEPYKPDSKDKVFLPGDGAPQWRLKGEVQAKCIATVLPGQRFEIRFAKH